MSNVSCLDHYVTSHVCPQCASHRGPRWRSSTGCGPKRSARAIYMWRAATFTPAPSSGAPSTSTCVSPHSLAHSELLLLLRNHYTNEKITEDSEECGLTACHFVFMFVQCKCSPRCRIVITHAQRAIDKLNVGLCAYEMLRPAGGSLLIPLLRVFFSGRRGVRRRGVHCERRLHPLRPDRQAGVLGHRHGPA